MVKFQVMEIELQEPALAYVHQYSFDDFLKMAETHELRYEYWNGEVLAMSNASKDHADITFNFHAEIKKRLKGGNCKSFQESVFLRIEKTNHLFLPDIVVTCNPIDFDRDSRFLDYPTMIIEVLSDATELNDRNYKWQQYKKISSLKYYLLVSQKKPFIEVYARKNPQSLFYLQDVEGLNSIVDLKFLDLQIPMHDIYEGIVFDERG